MRFFSYSFCFTNVTTIIFGLRPGSNPSRVATGLLSCICPWSALPVPLLWRDQTDACLHRLKNPPSLASNVRKTLAWSASGLGVGGIIALLSNVGKAYNVIHGIGDNVVGPVVATTAGISRSTRGFVRDLCIGKERVTAEPVTNIADACLPTTEAKRLGLPSSNVSHNSDASAAGAQVS